jgi:GTP-binding protein HflX
LLNTLTGANALSADKLFATLDPTSRRLRLPTGRVIVLTDTVGFIRKLPHRLVDSFKATLEEALVADLILHLVDLSNPEYEAQMNTTEKVLDELGASDNESVTVYNKVDRGGDEIEKLRAKKVGNDAVFISAQTGEGLPLLIEHLEEIFAGKRKVLKYLVPLNRYELVARLRAQGELIKEETSDDGYTIHGSPRDGLIQTLEQFRMPN